MKRAIFTYWNYEINPDIPMGQQKVIKKLQDDSFTFEPLQYNAHHTQVVPNQVIDYGLRTLFDERGYDTVLILDVDCIPLSIDALNYTFEQAENGILVGNIQRSNHIQNDEHVYVAPSAMCLTKDMYNEYGRIPFAPTYRGDISEEYTYFAEQNNLPVEMYMPSKVEAECFSGGYWNLKTGMPQYGIGTTFVNKYGKEMFYHLFESRVHKFNELFVNKCNEMLEAA